MPKRRECQPGRWNKRSAKMGPKKYFAGLPPLYFSSISFTIFLRLALQKIKIVSSKQYQQNGANTVSTCADLL